VRIDFQGNTQQLFDTLQNKKAVSDEEVAKFAKHIIIQGEKDAITIREKPFYRRMWGIRHIVHFFSALIKKVGKYETAVALMQDEEKTQTNQLVAKIMNHISVNKLGRKDLEVKLREKQKLVVQQVRVKEEKPLEPVSKAASEEVHSVEDPNKAADATLLGRQTEAVTLLSSVYEQMGRAYMEIRRLGLEKRKEIIAKSDAWQKEVQRFKAERFHGMEELLPSASVKLSQKEVLIQSYMIAIEKMEGSFRSLYHDLYKSMVDDFNLYTGWMEGRRKSVGPEADEVLNTKDVEAIEKEVKKLRIELARSRERLKEATILRSPESYGGPEEWVRIWFIFPGFDGNMAKLQEEYTKAIAKLDGGLAQLKELADSKKKEALD